MSLYVDLDGTLAFYAGWVGMAHIGEPIPAILAHVKGALARGETVKLFTARASAPEEDRAEFLAAWKAWCARHGLPEIEATAVKGFDLVTLLDDRAYHVVPNTGRIVIP